MRRGDRCIAASALSRSPRAGSLPAATSNRRLATTRLCGRLKPRFLAALALTVALFVNVTLLRAEPSAAWRNGPLADRADNRTVLLIRHRTLEFQLVPHIRGHHDDGHVRVERAQSVEGLNAIEVGHLDIHGDEVEPPGLSLPDSAPRRGHRRLVSDSGEHVAQGVEHSGIVVVSLPVPA